MLGSLASRGRYQDTIDRSKANAALGDLKSIDNLEATGDLTAAEAKALREATGKAGNNADVAPSSPLGSSRNQMNQPKPPDYQTRRNSPTTINGRDYSGHALDRMQDRGIPPSAVENAIKNGTKTPQNGGKTKHYDPINNVTVITNKNGGVVTTHYGQH